MLCVTSREGFVGKGDKSLYREVHVCEHKLPTYHSTAHIEIIQNYKYHKISGEIKFVNKLYEWCNIYYE